MTATDASEPPRSSTTPARRRRRGPGRFLLPAAAGLALLAWALELGRDRKRNTGPADPGGPLLEHPAPDDEATAGGTP